MSALTQSAEQLTNLFWSKAISDWSEAKRFT